MPRGRRPTEDGIPPSIYPQPTLDRFAEDTSMIGFRYLHTRYKTWFRVLWGLVLVFVLGLTIYQVCERISYYFIRNPLTTRRSYESPQSMKFPTIAVCNKMQMRASKLADSHPELLKAMCFAYEDDGTVNQNDSFLNSLNSFKNVKMIDIHRSAQQTIEDLFVSCEIGKHGSCIDDIVPFYSPSGLCFAVTPNITVRRPGPETTLSLLLNLESYDVIPGWVTDPGVMLSIYENGQSYTEYTQGIHLEAGKVVTIPINEVRKLSRYERYCGRKAVGPFSSSEYSLEACKWAESVDRVEKECNCRPLSSPHNKQSIIGEVKNTTTSKKRRVPDCTLKEELSCVAEVMYREEMEPSNFTCPEDCHDISYSSVVFGGPVISSEISSLLPSDWEDQKELRVANFQKALDVIPDSRVPVVRQIQLLANEAQHFVELAEKVFAVSTNSSAVCLSENGRRTIDTVPNAFRTNENIWERATTYLSRSLAHEINSTAQAIGVRMDNDGKILDSDGPFNLSLASLALMRLGYIEQSLQSRPDMVFGLKLVEKGTMQKLIQFVLPFIHKMRDCVNKLQDTGEEETAKECRKTFVGYLTALQDATLVYETFDPKARILQDFEELANRIATALRRVIYSSRVAALDWKDHKIDLRTFESLYRETGKDSQEIHDLMKLRKPMMVEIVNSITTLLDFWEKGLVARRRYLNRLSLELDDESLKDIQNVMDCLRGVRENIPELKKSPFVRGEWLTRVQKQVQLVQSYGATLQYDQVNLLHIKLYYAHFKQETIIQDRSYNLFLLLAEIGGTIGLYVGATLLTVAETIVFFFEKRTRNFILKPTLI